jgi:hypothetical protein
MRLIAQRAMRERKNAFLFVNNRLEGNAPSTIGLRPSSTRSRYEEKCRGRQTGVGPPRVAGLEVKGAKD